MNTPSNSIRDLTQRLLAAEAENRNENTAHEAVLVTEKLRISLTRIAGPDGFSALMRRALVIARTEFPLLQTVEVATDGELKGIEELFDEAAGAEAGAAINTHLLWLLVMFIGEPLTMQMVREIWPDAAMADE